jgi:hypothetical protein
MSGQTGRFKVRNNLGVSPSGVFKPAAELAWTATTRFNRIDHRLPQSDPVR